MTPKQKDPYTETRRRSSRNYQRRTQKTKTTTHRIGRASGRAISTTTQTHLNTATGTVSISCAIWHKARYIYPTEK